MSPVSSNPAASIQPTSTGISDNFAGQPGGLPPTPPNLLPPPTASYLPPFPFPMAPELLPKNPFLPYDFNALRAARMLQHQYPLHQGANIPGMNHGNPSLTNGLHRNTANDRLSPVSSSRPSSSSPTSSSHHKLNLSIDIHSNQDSEDSDDEQIDVVKSAFVPILRPKLELADSTTMPQTTPPESESPPPKKSSLKAPSSRRHILHEIAPTIVPQSPDTKLKTSPISAQITVWRPY